MVEHGETEFQAVDQMVYPIDKPTLSWTRFFKAVDNVSFPIGNCA